MKVTKAEYNESIQVAEGHWKKFGIEKTSTSDDETYEELETSAIADVKKVIEKELGFYPIHNPGFVMTVHSLPQVTAEKPIPEEQRQAIMIAEILACKVLDDGNGNGLLSFEKMVQSAKKPDITAAYQLMLKKLS